MEQGSILPARAGQFTAAYMAQQLITNLEQLSYIGIIVVVNSASSPLFMDSWISSWIRHGLQYKVYKI